MSKNFRDKEERTYEIEGLGRFPSVTTIIGQLDKSGPLMGWAVKTMYEYLLNHQQELKAGVEPSEVFKRAKEYYKELQTQALDFGSALHNLIEVYLKGQKIDGLLQDTPALKNGFEEFKRWQGDVGFKLIESEHIVWSEEYRYAGTLDCVATLKEGDLLYVVDFKSSKAIYDEYLMQVAAYLKAYEERSEKIVSGLGILRLPKTVNDTYEWREYTLAQANGAFDAFMCLVSYWWQKNRNKKGEKDGYKNRAPDK